MDIVNRYLNSYLFPKYNFNAKEKQYIYSYIQGSQNMCSLSKIRGEDLDYVNLVKRYYHNKDGYFILLLYAFLNENEKKQKLIKKVGALSTKYNATINNYKNKIQDLESQLKSQKPNTQKHNIILEIDNILNNYAKNNNIDFKGLTIQQKVEYVLDQLTKGNNAANTIITKYNLPNGRTLQEKLHTISIFINDLQNNNMILNTRVLSLIKANRDLISSFTKKTNDHIQVEKINEQLKRDALQYRARIEELTKMLQTALQSVKRLEIQNGNLLNKVAQLENDVLRLQYNNEELGIRIQSLIEELKGKDDIIANLENINKQFKGHEQRYNERIKKLTETLQIALDGIKYMKDQNKDQSKNILLVEQEIERLEKDNDNFRGIIEDIRIMLVNHDMNLKGDLKEMLKNILDKSDTNAVIIRDILDLFGMNEYDESKIREKSHMLDQIIVIYKNIAAKYNINFDDNNLHLVINSLDQIIEEVNKVLESHTLRKITKPEDVKDIANYIKKEIEDRVESILARLNIKSDNIFANIMNIENIVIDFITEIDNICQENGIDSGLDYISKIKKIGSELKDCKDQNKDHVLEIRQLKAELQKLINNEKNNNSLILDKDTKIDFLETRINKLLSVEKELEKFKSYTKSSQQELKDYKNGATLAIYKLEKEIELLRAERNKFKNDYLSSEGENNWIKETNKIKTQEYENIIQNYEKIKYDLEQELGNGQKVIDNLRNEIQELKAKKEKIKKECDDLLLDKDIFLKKFNRLDNIIKDLYEFSQKIGITIDNPEDVLKIKENYEEKEEFAKKLILSLMEQRDKVNNLELSLQGQKNKVNDLETEIDNILIKNFPGIEINGNGLIYLNVFIEDFVKLRKIIDEQCDKFKIGIGADYEGKINNIGQRLSSLDDQLAEKNKEILLLNDIQKLLEEDNVDLGLLLKKSEISNAAISEELKASKRSIESYKKAIKDVSIHVQKKKAERKAIIKLLEKEKEDQRITIDNKIKEINILTTKIAELEALLINYQKDLNDVKTNNDNVISDFQNQINELKSIINEKETEILRLNSADVDAKKKAENELQRYKDIETQLRLDIASYLDRIAGLQEDQKNANTEINKLEQEIINNKIIIDELKASEKRLRDAKNIKIGKIRQSKEEYIKLYKDSKQEVKNINLELERLRNEQQETKSNINNLKGLLQERETQIAEYVSLKVKLENDLMSRLSKYENQIQNLNNNATLSNEIDTYKERITRLEEEKEQLEQINIRLQSVNTTSIGEIDRLTLEVTELKENISRIDLELGQCRTELVQCNEKLDQCNNEKNIAPIIVEQINQINQVNNGSDIINVFSYNLQHSESNMFFTSNFEEYLFSYILSNYDIVLLQNVKDVDLKTILNSYKSHRNIKFDIIDDMTPSSSSSSSSSSSGGNHKLVTLLNSKKFSYNEIESNTTANFKSLNINVTSLENRNGYKIINVIANNKEDNLVEFPIMPRTIVGGVFYNLTTKLSTSVKYTATCCTQGSGDKNKAAKHNYDKIYASDDLIIKKATTLSPKYGNLSTRSLIKLIQIEPPHTHTFSNILGKLNDPLYMADHFPVTATIGNHIRI